MLLLSSLEEFTISSLKIDQTNTTWPNPAVSPVSEDAPLAVESINV